MIEKKKKWEKFVTVGLHGRIINVRFDNYYDYFKIHFIKTGKRDLRRLSWYRLGPSTEEPIPR